MRLFYAPSRIRPNAGVLVKLAIALALIVPALASWTALADDAAPTDATPVADASPTPDASPAPDAAPAASSDLPEIEAYTYDVTIARRSNSGRVYLVESEDGTLPKFGKIMLFKAGSEPIMAFRVLKTYPETRSFAARRLRSYGGHFKLNTGDQFTAIEKVADIGGNGEAPAPLTKEDNTELKEIEGGNAAGAASGEPEQPAAQPFDAELDSGKAGPTTEGTETKEEANPEKLLPDEQEDIDDLMNIEVEELPELERENNSFSLGFGAFRNFLADGASTGYFVGGVARYSITVLKPFFLKRKAVQDSLSLEGSAGFYRLLNYAQQNDSDAYSVVPLTMTLRYNVMTGENFGIFFYAGLNYNYVMAAFSPSAALNKVVANGAATLTSILPAIGAGLTFRVGPNWFTRFDLGLDVIAGSLMLRF